MNTMRGQAEIGRNEVLRRVSNVLRDMISEQAEDINQVIDLDLRLVGDLDFESIDIVQFAVELQKEFGRRDLPFERLLMGDGWYTDELRVADVVDFLCVHLK